MRYRTPWHRHLQFGLSSLLLMLGITATLPVVAWDEFMVLTTDFTTLGAVTSVQRHEPWAASQDQEFVHSDAVARYRDGLYYVVGRGSGNHIQVLDPAQGYQSLNQFSLGTGLNPQDIAFRSDGTAYVSCYDVAQLLKVDVESGLVLDSFSTAGFADADGLPETAWMLAVGDLLYIACQLLDRNNWYLPTGPGLLLVFDMTSDSWIDVLPGTPEVDGIALSVANPYTPLELNPERNLIRVGCNGVYGVLDAGVEMVTLSTHASLGCEVTEETLGGDIIDFVTVAEDRAFVIVSDLDFHTALLHYNPATGGGVQQVAVASSYAFVDLAHDGAELLYLADRTLGASGLRVFAVHTLQELTGVPVATGMPPAFIALPSGEPPAEVQQPGRFAWHLQMPWPNPANPGTHIRFQGPPGQQVSLRIFDLRGSLVLQAQVFTDGNGQGSFDFRGRDAVGRPVASGIYHVVVGQAPGMDVRSLSVVR